MAEAILVFDLVVFDFILILNLNMPKKYSLFMVYSFLLNVEIFCKILRLPLYFFVYNIFYFIKFE